MLGGREIDGPGLLISSSPHHSHSTSTPASHSTLMHSSPRCKHEHIRAHSSSYSKKNSTLSLTSHAGRSPLPSLPLSSMTSSRCASSPPSLSTATVVRSSHCTHQHEASTSTSIVVLLMAVALLAPLVTTRGSRT